jgi:hypothetical protein
MSTQARRTCIVLDTNAWLPDHMLRVRMGASLLHAVIRLDAVIGFPEIVDLELERQWHLQCRETLEAAAKLGETLRGMSDAPLVMSLPKEDALLQAYQKRVEELKKVLQPVPLTLAHVHGALARILAHLPPSGPNNEQFRDTAIWEAVLELAKTFNVHFITADKGFFSERNPKKGLAENLLEDVKQAGERIWCYPSVKDCLEALKQEVKPLDEASLATMVAAAVRPQFAERVGKADFALGEVQNYEVRAFETGKPELALSYALTFILEPTRAGDTSRLEARATASGECTFDPKNTSVAGIRTEAEELTWLGPDGQRHRAVPANPWRFRFKGGDIFKDWVFATADQTVKYADLFKNVTLTFPKQLPTWEEVP